MCKDVREGTILSGKNKQQDIDQENDIDDPVESKLVYGLHIAAEKQIDHTTHGENDVEDHHS